MKRLLWRLFVVYHVFAILRWQIGAQVRLWEGTFWATNKLWLAFAYAANPWVWEDLVWAEMTGERERGR